MIKTIIRVRISAAAILLLLLVVCVSSQTAVETGDQGTRVRDQKLTSKLMAREMPYRVILPSGYENSTENSFYPAIYLLHGLTGHFDNWSDNTKLAVYSKNSEFIIVMPEGGNGWYTDSVSKKDEMYESYIVKELIPEIEKKFRVKKARESRAIAGLSMGGYGALKFGVKYPEMFVVAGSFSGALRAAEWTEKELGVGFRPLLESIMSIYGEAGSGTRKQNDLFSLVNAKTDTEIKAMPFIYVDCGTEDFLLSQNRDFAELLLKRKVSHEFRQRPGVHDWKYWDSQIKEFLQLSERFLK